MRRIKSVIVSLFVAVLLLSGCGSTEKIEGSEYLRVLQTAVDNLSSFETPYIISTVVEASNEYTQYIECVNGDVSYTEYSIDADGNFGTLEYGSQSSISYVLNDWLDADGKYYLFTTNEAGEDTIYVVDNYKDTIDSRVNMYGEDLLKGVLSVEKIDDMTIDLGQGMELFSVYRCKISSDVIKDVLGAPSLGIYKALKSSAESGSNLDSLLQYYIEDFDMTLTFSDANVIFGIDKNNCLKYLVIEVGGLGSRMYVTKAVVETNNENLRETPDFRGAVPFSNTLLELADYVANFDSYEDALNAVGE